MSTWAAETDRKFFVSCRLNPLSVTIVIPYDRGLCVRSGICSSLKFIFYGFSFREQRYLNFHVCDLLKNVLYDGKLVNSTPASIINIATNCICESCSFTNTQPISTAT